MKSSVQLRQEFLNLSALLLLPPLMLSSSIIVKSFITISVILLYFFKNGRVNPVPSFILFTAVVTASVLRPAGEVLVYAAGFPVTKDSLISGISRALLLTGLVYISRFAVSASLPVPGKIGDLLGSVFFYFNRISGTDWKYYYRKEKRFSFISSFTRFLDDLLFISDSTGTETVSGVSNGNVPVVLMILIVAASYTLQILYFLKYL